MKGMKEKPADWDSMFYVLESDSLIYSRTERLVPIYQQGMSLTCNDMQELM